MPQIYDMGPTALLPLRKKACWKIRRIRPGLNPQTWVLKASMLPLDHRSRKILEKKWEYNEVVRRLFVDYKNSYDSVKREVLYNILVEFGIPMIL